MRSLVASLLISSLVSQAALAQHRNPLLNGREQLMTSSASEFVFRNEPDEVLIPVYLLGAVSKPGLYHVPTKTDLVSLLTLSGGPLAQADLEHVMVRSQTKNQVSEVNLPHVLSERDLRPPTLSGNDVILIETKEPAISNNTIIVVGLVSSIIGLIVSGLVVQKALQKK